MKKLKNNYRLKEIKLEVFYTCELKCIHCSSDASMTQKDMISLNEALRVITSAESMGVETISISGGEPIQWPHLFEFLSVCSTKKFNIRLYTSGYPVDIVDKVKQFAKNDFTIIFSLYGASASVHEKVTRVKGSFDRTINSLKNAAINNIRTQIHFVPLSINYKDLISVAELSKSFGVKKISILRFVPQGRGASSLELDLSKGQYVELKKAIVDLRNADFNIRTGSPLSFLLLDNPAKCSSGIDKLIIGPDLKIYPCDAFKQLAVEDIFGEDEFSCLKKNDLRICWEKSKYLKEIRNILLQEYHEPCKSCKNLNLCNSGCLAQKILHNMDRKSLDPKCLIDHQFQ